MSTRRGQLVDNAGGLFNFHMAPGKKDHQLKLKRHFHNSIYCNNSIKLETDGTPFQKKLSHQQKSLHKRNGGVGKALHNRHSSMSVLEASGEEA